LIRYDDSVSEETLLRRVQQLNEDTSIDGFIVQLPLPAHIDEMKVTLAIDPKKDVDGFHPFNVGNMVLNLPGFLSATPAGIMELMHRNGIVTEGKHCVIIGRSNIVGTPLSIMLTRNTNPGNCTVTLTHSHTQNLKDICLTADILIAALGQPEFVTADMIKPGAVVIDVGTSRIEDSTKKSGWRLAGDVKFDEVASKCSFISPVPGGVGPMTIASLMINTLKAMDLKGK
jgi:methylenetetrahydrofolate dehydrogenase (NADP+)/methenyltetrahydrofolate cyclohydrolase